MARELIWPPSLRITHIERRLIGNAGVSRSPLSGATTTVDRSGDRWAISVTIENLSDRASYAERAAAETFLAAIRNRNARVWIHDPAYVQRGSFAAPELFTNADFANGTTGWNAYNSTLAVSDRVLRATSTGTTSDFGVSRTAGAVIGVPYVLRAAFAGSHVNVPQIMAEIGGGASQVSRAEYSGMVASSFVANATSPVAYAFHNSDGGVRASRYLDLNSISLARCALVDNAPNVLTQSNDFSHADWTKSGTTVTANYFTAPDGTLTAARIIEDTSAGEHFVLQSKTRTNAVTDWCFAVALATGDVGGLRNRARLRILDSAAVNYITADFDLLSGAISVSAAAAGSAANPRAFIAPIGGPIGHGYYYCAVVGQMPASDTTIRGVVNLIENPSTTSYTGASSRNIAAWRGTLAQSSVPVRLSDRTTAAPSGDTQTGSGLYLKGLPPSTSGLLLAGDSVQIGKQWFKVLAPLDSDAAGLGYLQVSPNIRTPFADNEPVIINQPMGRYMLASDSAGYTTRAGLFSTFTLELEEALD